MEGSIGDCFKCSICTSNIYIDLFGRSSNSNIIIYKKGRLQRGLIVHRVIDLFHQIRDTDSLNGKKEIIVANKDNELFKKCLVFLLDGNITTGISDSKIKKIDEKYTYNKKTVDLKSFSDVMDYLKANNTGKDEDIANVKNFLYKDFIPDNEFEFYVQMITKKYRLGADKKLVNSCIPNLIPTFDVMLGTGIDKCKLSGNETIYISRKLNGVRCSFIGTKCLSRQNKEFLGVEHIIQDLINVVGTEIFVDGELIYKNKEGLSDSAAFQKGTGIAMSKEPDKTDLKLVIFDAFPIDQFWSGKSNAKYSSRRKYLNCLDKKIQEMKIENLEVVKCLYSGKDHSQIWNWLDFAEASDWEGIMLNLDTEYECKRTKNLIKVKRFYTYDLEVVGLEEGTGRNKETLGALVVKYKNNTVKVGTGLSDEERIYYWTHPDEILGRVVEVKYKEITVDKKTGLESLQFPVFVCRRENGKEPSYN